MFYLVYFVIGFATAAFNAAYQSPKIKADNRRTFGSAYGAVVAIAVVLQVLLWPAYWVYSLIKAVRSFS